MAARPPVAVFHVVAVPTAPGPCKLAWESGMMTNGQVAESGSAMPPGASFDAAPPPDPRNFNLFLSGTATTIVSPTNSGRPPRHQG